MFLPLSIILSTGGVLHTHPPWADNPHGQTPPRQTETATAADGTHPNGMHSCFRLRFRVQHRNYVICSAGFQV